MKTVYTFFALFFVVSISYSQEDLPVPADENEPEVKVDVKKEYDEEGNVIRFDSSYAWKWSDQGTFDEETLKKFEEKMKKLHEDMEVWNDDFFSGFHFDDNMLKDLREFHEDFKFNFDDSVLYKDHWEDLFDENHFQFHGFNFDGNNFEVMPFDKERIEEMEKRMKDLFDGEFDERIRKFIEEHKHEIDEIRDQIHESIPNYRKAI